MKYKEIPDYAFCVYPGHAVMIALNVFDTFKSASEAIDCSKTFSGCSAMQGSGDVPGAGCGVSICQGMISKVLAKELSIDEMFDYANKRWKDHTGPGSGNFESHYEKGLAEALKYKDLFLEKAKAWNWS